MSRISAASGRWLGWSATMHSCLLSSFFLKDNSPAHYHHFFSKIIQTWTRSLASLHKAGGGHWKHWTLWIVLCTETSSRNTGSSMMVAKEVRPATPCKLEEESEVEVVTLPKHLPISSTSTTALREKVGLSNRILVPCVLRNEICYVWLVFLLLVWSVWSRSLQNLIIYELVQGLLLNWQEYIISLVIIIILKKNTPRYTFPYPIQSHL